MRVHPALLAGMLLCACARDSGPPALLGTLEWDRIGVPAEVSEPITQILVHEGDEVAEQQLLLTLDPQRVQAQVDAAQADAPCNWRLGWPLAMLA